jgi:DNA (cytosine-5)-methyltransferase 1
MARNLTYVELFAGAGGMSLGLETAGWRCVAHAEIEPHARAVLRHHWPDVPLYGDVTELDGTQFRGVTMVTGGSPCQDLSIAGKRAGMTEGSGTRSSLFFEQVRIWNESQAPYILWENVYGAFSSNAGRDFAAVLTALVGADVPVPAKRWKRAGYVVGPAGIAAWRTLDAQYFGVPQRRRRVFVLGARAGGVNPAEVFALAESLSGHLAASGEAGEGVAAGAGERPESGIRKLAFQNSGDIGNRSISVFDETHPTLRTSPKSDGGVGIMSFATDAGRGAPGAGESNCLTPWDNQGKRVYADNGVWPTLYSAASSGQQQQSVLALAVNIQVVFTKQRIDEYAEKNVGSTLAARDYKSVSDIVAGVGVPRRLTPVECERLMGWPDRHTAHGINEKGKAYALADTARYKLCGNGIASPVTAWIGFQLRDMLSKTA